MLVRHNKKVSNYNMKQGTLTEGEGSVQLTSLYYFRSATFDTANNYLLLFFTKQVTLNKRSTVQSLSLQLVFRVCNILKSFCGISSKFENDSRGQTLVNVG